MTFVRARRRAGRYIFAPVPPSFSGVPSIVGTPTEGVAPTYTAAQVAGTQPITEGVQWLLDGVSQGASFTPALGDAGKMLAVRQTATSTWGNASATSAAVAIVASGAPVAPAFKSGFAGRPLIVGMAKVGNTVTYLSGQMAVSGNPAPTVSVEWRLGEDGMDSTVVSTASSFTFTLEHMMMECELRITKDNGVGTPAVSTSYRVRVMPSWWVSPKDSAGAPADGGQTSDPATAAAWVDTSLYEAGAVVTKGGQAYIQVRPFSYNKDPVTYSTGTRPIWEPIAATFYFDPVNGRDTYTGTAGVWDGVSSTSVGPWQTMDAMRKKITSNTTGFVAAPARSLFLFKAGMDAPWSCSFGAYANVPYWCGRYGTGARPILRYAPQTQAIITAAGQPTALMQVNKSAASGMRFFDLDLRGESLSMVRYSLDPGSLPLNVGDVINATLNTMVNGVYPTWSATVKYMFTTGTTTLQYWMLVQNTVRTSVVTYNSTWNVTGGASGTIANAQAEVNYPIGISSFGTGVYGWAAARCNIEGFSGHGALVATGETSVNGDHFLLKTRVANNATDITNGAGVDGQWGARSAVWFCELYNNGTPDSTRNHNAYNSQSIWWSFIGNKSWMDANYGSSGLVMHGNQNSDGTSQVATIYGGNEIAYNWIKGCRVGMAHNDGYSAAEKMFGFNNHNNLVEDIGANNNAAGYSWDIALINDGRFYNNVTVNGTPASFIDQRTIDGGTGDTTLANAVLAHNDWINTVVCIGSSNDGTAAGSIVNLSILNNIFYSAAAIQLYKGSTMQNAQLTLDGNGYWRVDGGQAISWDKTSTTSQSYTGAVALHSAVNAFEAAGKTADPLFTNAATRDYSLQAGSTLRNAGLDARYACGFTVDFMGVTRTNAAPHIGAFQTA